MQPNPDDLKIKTFSLISEISNLCHQCPRLVSAAVEGLNNIIHQINRLNYAQIEHPMNFVPLQQQNLNRISNMNENQNGSENISYEQFKDIINSVCNNPENISIPQNSNDNILKLCAENPLFVEYLKRYSEDMSKETSNQI
ncbi:hypothetical protein M9Y10_012452 [Tritrichomonas musculus]|uniref:Uncharacterized protein n=1 Tax=Tritrichomonas musculus TaxID=1915356 RepID=A0ABR2ID76_9EUKA